MLSSSLQTFVDVASPVQAEVQGKSTSYPAGWVIEPHRHATHQLLYAVQGVMVVSAEGGQWVVPPTRGLWIPAETEHALRCVGELQMRSLFVAAGVSPALPSTSQVVGVPALLRELIQAFVQTRPPYAADSRDGRLARLILDELGTLPVLPLHLPQASDPRLRRVCAHLQERLDDASPLEDWATKFDLNVKTLQRLFAKDTGMTFGQWRQQARLLRALERLACGQKVIDVAQELGYDSPGAFATMFRRQFGQAPSQFFR